MKSSNLASMLSHVKVADVTVEFRNSAALSFVIELFRLLDIEISEEQMDEAQRKMMFPENRAIVSAIRGFPVTTEDGMPVKGGQP